MLYLNGLGYVHFINLNLRKATSGHIFIFLIIAIKKVSGVDSNADGSLGQKNRQSAPSAGVLWSENTEAECSGISLHGRTVLHEAHKAWMLEFK